MTTFAPPLAPPARSVRRDGPLLLRLRLTGRAAVLSLTSLVGVALLPLWLTLVAVSPITVVVPLALGATTLVRAYADAHRRSVGRLRGAVVARPYRPSEAGLFRRYVVVLRDPASWRDAAWLCAHAVVGFVTATLTVALLLGTVFWAIFPFLYAVTPQAAFGHALGFVTIHSVAQAFLFVPLAAVAFGLWWALTVPAARADAALTARLLGPRRTA